MATDLRERLQSSLGSAYTLDRELGGAGMSRVFVADETAFSRKVVVKVLPPDLAAGVSIDRFKREIQMAGRLQHPHIDPVHSAGEADGLPFFTMPYVDGSSLRARLAKSGMRSPKSSACCGRWHARWHTPTSTAWCTATSSPTTSCSRAGAPSSPTSGSRRRSAPRARSTNRRRP